MKSVGIYNLYWDTMGGGEANAGALAEELSKKYEVTLLGPTEPNINVFSQHLGVDLSACSFQKATNDDEASLASRQFDIFVNHTWMSSAVNEAASGVYLVMFPGNPRRFRSYVRSGAFRGLWVTARVLSFFLPRLNRYTNAFKRRIHSTQWLDSYQQFYSISPFTADWTSRLWRKQSKILWPPASRENKERPKEKIILSVGRFFSPESGHCKRQLELVEAFRALYSSGEVEGWRLVLAGGCAPVGRDYYLEVRRAAQGLPIDVCINLPGPDLEDLFSRSSLYWHATGYGQSERKFPVRFEHFGISVVEAMAAGVVPLVLGNGGPAHTVRNEIDGLHWNSLKDLTEVTSRLMTDAQKMEEFSASAQKRATEFDRATFGNSVRELFQNIEKR